MRKTKASVVVHNYEIFDDGRIISFPSLTRKERKTLKPVITKVGYERICLFVGGKRTYHFVHRLVATNFIPNPLNLPQVNHKDGNKRNNRKDNLEWVTGSENMKHSFRIGLRSLKGENHNKAFLTNEKAIEIYNAEGTQENISITFGISRTMVSAIKTGRSWGHVTKLARN